MGIKKVTEALVRLPNIRSIGVIGDPGCEGLGTYNMKVYAGALGKTTVDDITLVAGDLVPEGSPFFYQLIGQMTAELAENDVYVLRGNHDTGAYQDYCGRHNYAILTDSFAMVVLDNAMRTFEQEGLDLLSQVLSRDDVQQAIITFHIPIPNHFINNAVSKEEFQRLQAAYAPWKEKVKFFLFGHVHSRFEDVIDGIPAICTGGGGARIEDVSPEILAHQVNHHVVHFFLEGTQLGYRFEDILEPCYDREREDPVLRERLEETVRLELMAHLKYLMYADRAQRRGLKDLAGLFRTLAASEYYHARNFYSVLQRPAAFGEGVAPFLPEERFEHETFYPALAAYAKSAHAPLSAQAYESAAVAEAVHEALLKQALVPEAYVGDGLYVCPICGNVMTQQELPDRCPVCGAPSREFEQPGAQ